MLRIFIKTLILSVLVMGIITMIIWTYLDKIEPYIIPGVKQNYTFAYNDLECAIHGKISMHLQEKIFKRKLHFNIESIKECLRKHIENRLTPLLEEHEKTHDSLNGSWFANKYYSWKTQQKQRVLIKEVIGNIINQTKINTEARIDENKDIDNNYAQIKEELEIFKHDITSEILYRLEHRIGKFKTILYWIPFWFFKDYLVGTGRKPFLETNCEINACIITNDKSLLNISDALVFHNINFAKTHRYSRPPYRFPWQHWVFMEMEVPGRDSPEGKDIKHYNGLFNITQTYMKSSDVYNGYGEIQKLSTKEKTQLSLPSNYAAGKTKLVAWFVSNCGKKTRRLQYAQELQKTIPIDIYGKCGTLKCKRNHPECFKMLNRDYKFYLSFENSLCTDYVTEKLWKILTLNIIPVVIGNFDYHKYLPNKSVIVTTDFKSPSDLGKYLFELDKDDTLYNQYFDWKKEYKVISPYFKNAFCNLCKFLHLNKDRTFVHQNLSDWWSTKKQCIPAEEYWKGHADMII